MTVNPTEFGRLVIFLAGFAKEYDKPSRLPERPSLFAALVKEYSKRSA